VLDSQDPFQICGRLCQTRKTPTLAILMQKPEIAVHLPLYGLFKGATRPFSRPLIVDLTADAAAAQLLEVVLPWHAIPFADHFSVYMVCAYSLYFDGPRISQFPH
jgi:hypothetical protein